MRQPGSFEIRITKPPKVYKIQSTKALDKGLTDKVSELGMVVVSEPSSLEIGKVFIAGVRPGLWVYIFSNEYAWKAVSLGRKV